MNEDDGRGWNDNRMNDKVGERTDRGYDEDDGGPMQAMAGGHKDNGLSCVDGK